MTYADSNDLAITIEDARRSASLVERFTDRYPDLELPQAYDVLQRASMLRGAATGARPVGRKIGFTNMTIWDLYGVYGPIWGWMYDDSMKLCDAASTTIDISRLVQPRIEPEIVFCLADDVPVGAQAHDIAGLVEWVAFGFEMVQCHYPDWKVTAVDSVIDGSLHGASRVGTRIAPWPTMVDDLERFSLRLMRNGTVIDEGRGANVLGSPLNALAHLAESASVPLHAGEIITTGTITDAAWVRPGEEYTVEIHGLPLQALTVLITG